MQTKQKIPSGIPAFVDGQPIDFQFSFNGQTFRVSGTTNLEQRVVVLSVKPISETVKPSSETLTITSQELAQIESILTQQREGYKVTVDYQGKVAY